MKAFAQSILHSIGPAHRALSRRRGTLIHSADYKLKTQRLGSSYGGWTIDPELLSAKSTIYCVGIGTDISFDLALMDRFGCDIHGFDPTPASRAWIERQQLPAQYHYHAIGLSATDGDVDFLIPEHEGWASYGKPGSDTRQDKVVKCPVHRLSRIASELGHSKIDLLKMDIEGFEYDVIDDIAGGSLRPHQLLVEFHHGMYSHTQAETETAVRTLKSAGYRLFHVSNVGHEYSFVHAGADIPLKA